MIKEVRRRLNTDSDQFDFCLVRKIRHSDVRPKNFLNSTENQHLEILKEFVLDDIKNKGYIKTNVKEASRTGDKLVSAEIKIAFTEIEVIDGEQTTYS